MMTNEEKELFIKSLITLQGGIKEIDKDNKFYVENWFREKQNEYVILQSTRIINKIDDIFDLDDEQKSKLKEIFSNY